MCTGVFLLLKIIKIHLCRRLRKLHTMQNRYVQLYTACCVRNKRG